MDPISLALLIGGLAAGVGGSVWGAKRQEKYQKDTEAYQENERKKSRRETYRNALMRAIKADNVPFRPSTPDRAPEAPSMTGPAVLQGVGTAANMLGSNLSLNNSMSPIQDDQYGRAGWNGALTRGARR